MVPSFPQILPFPLGAAGSHESAFHFCRCASVLGISCKWIPATCRLSSPAFLAQRGVSGFSCAVAVDQYLLAFSQLNNIPLDLPPMASSSSGQGARVLFLLSGCCGSCHCERSHTSARVDLCFPSCVDVYTCQRNCWVIRRVSVDFLSSHPPTRCFLQRLHRFTFFHQQVTRTLIFSSFLLKSSQWV